MGRIVTLDWHLYRSMTTVLAESERLSALPKLGLRGAHTALAIVAAVGAVLAWIPREAALNLDATLQTATTAGAITGCLYLLLLAGVHARLGCLVTPLQATRRQLLSLIVVQAIVLAAVLNCIARREESRALLVGFHYLLAAIVAANCLSIMALLVHHYAVPRAARLPAKPPARSTWQLLFWSQLAVGCFLAVGLIIVEQLPLPHTAVQETDGTTERDDEKPKNAGAVAAGKLLSASIAGRGNIRRDKD